MLRYYFVYIFILFHTLTSFGSGDTLNFTTPHVIQSINYPEPYPSNVNRTWIWSKENGIWAVLFEDFDLKCHDFLQITVGLPSESKPKKIPVGCSHKSHTPIYTQGSYLSIKFASSSTNNEHIGFKLKILSGKDLDDVKSQVYDLNNDELSYEKVNPNVYTLLYVLLVLICLLVVGFSLWVAFVKKRRQNNSNTNTLEVEVSVNHIRRGSGITYKKSASTSESIDSNGATSTKVEICRTKVQRTPSQRSWTARAALAKKGTDATDNLYTPMYNSQEESRALSRVIEVDQLNSEREMASCTPVYKLPFTRNEI